MQQARVPLRSDMGWSTPTSITVRGKDLCNDVLGELNLGDFVFLEILGRTPSPQESIVFNAMLATLVEHGMTPMALSARLIYLGAPESLQPRWQPVCAASARPSPARQKGLHASCKKFSIKKATMPSVNGSYAMYEYKIW
jgi:hypothetical protein